MEQCGIRIKEAREAMGMTQEQLGEKLGVSGVSIMRYEKNQRQPRIELLQRMGNVLQINWMYLVGHPVGGETLAESARIYSEFKESMGVDEATTLLFEAIYGPKEEILVEGKWVSEPLTTFGKGKKAIAIDEQSFIVIQTAVCDLVKSLVGMMGEPAAKAKSDLQQALQSDEVKKRLDDVIARDASAAISRGEKTKKVIDEYFTEWKYSNEERAEFLKEHPELADMDGNTQE